MHSLSTDIHHDQHGAVSPFHIPKAIGLIWLFSSMPTPLVTPNTEPEMDISGDRAQRVAREATHVENIRLKRELEGAEIRNTLLCLGLRRTQRDLREMTDWAHGFYEAMLRIGAVGDRPSEATDVLAVCGEFQPPKPIMPPKMLKRKAVKKMLMLEDLGQLMLEDLGQLMLEDKGVVGLTGWFEKMEQVFEISKCAEEDKVKFAACTFKGRSLTWWNGNVHTLGLANANQIPWNNVKTMMTTEYCPITEIQRMEQELWTLTLKGDDIEGYNNRFHELALMCPDLVTPEKKKIERYIRGLPERVKANVTSSKPA
ncbi:putative reverse transcriptase domain-containing protein, partial [Tanacetum coccineum]